MQSRIFAMVQPDGQLLDPDQLRTISRDIRSIINQSEVSIEDSESQRIFEGTVIDVVTTSNSPTIDAVHRVAAWNALSTIIAQSLASNIAEIRDYIWKHDIWIRTFDAYLAHAPNARPKSTQQLLAALIASLNKGSDEVTGPARRHAAHKLLQAILNFDNPYRSKASIQLLSGLLGRDVLLLEDVLANEILERGPQVPQFSSHSLQYLLWILFQWICRSDFGSSIAQLISRLLERYDQDKVGDEPRLNETEAPVWALPLEVSISYGLVNVDDLRAHALPVLFKRSFGDLVSFLHANGLMSLTESSSEKSGSRNEQLLCVALQSGNELGLIRIERVKEIQQTPSALVLPVQWVGRLLLRESRMLRLTGLSLLVYSTSTLRPLPRASLQILKNTLSNFFADPDADFRSDLFGFFQNLLDRLRSVTAAQARQAKLRSNGSSLANDEGEDDPASVVVYHEQFLQWTVRFLTWELRPTASYQRHICSLKCLSILVKSGLDPAIQSSHLSKSALAEARWPFEMTILSVGLRNLLVNLLLDPFDDVRNASANTLSMYVSDSRTNGWTATIDTARDRATDLMLASGRADQADGVAHLWALKHRIMAGVGSGLTQPNAKSLALESLLVKLKEMLIVAKADLTEAVKRYPIHGILTSLRYVITQDVSGMSSDDRLQISGLLHEVWAIVKPTLCNDAPEGYLPDELNVGSSSTKEILSYCWRALKEASLLLNTLVQSSRISGDELADLCELCFIQLVELRHRGAFSTVAQTWVTCCLRSRDSRSPSGGSMVEEWYSKTIHMLENNITINTRRSAGLPSLLCGILAVDGNGEVMREAIADLTRISRLSVDISLAEEGSLPQVHAMNCIKDILKNSRLGERSNRYIASMLQLAADALRSDVWAIRNCGLMLFRAVIDRLLGTNDSFFGGEATERKHLSSEQYPELLEVILDLLEPSHPTSDSESVTRNEGVFPALQLLQYIEIPEARLAEVRESILALMANPSWHVRDTAARTYASIVKLQLQEYKDILGRSESGQNALHGSLLAARHFLIRIEAGQRGPQEPGSISAKRSLVSQLLKTTFDHYSAFQANGSGCKVTNAAYIDVVRIGLTLFASTIDNARSQDMIARISDIVGRATVDQILSAASIDDRLEECGTESGSAVMTQAVARLFAVRLVTMPNPETSERVTLARLVSRFADEDEDACSYLLEEMEHVLSLATQEGYDLICQECEKILRSARGWELKIAAQNLILRLSSYTRVPVPALTQKVDESSTDLCSLSEINQHYADGWLQARAIRLESKAVTSKTACTDEFRAQATAWINDCVSAIQGTNIFSPEAAANSLDRVDAVWHVLALEKSNSPIIGDICLAVYDILNDDDEDVRLQAARITRRILRAEVGKNDLDFDPITASQKLLSFCLQKPYLSDRLVTTAFDRAFRITAPNPRSVSDRLAAYSRTDNALFVQEKQNLYIDEAREIKLWSRAILKILTRETPRPLLEALAKWDVDGLGVLVARAKDTYDGGLGWTANSDVFVLGLQVIYGAEVLLWQVRNNSRIAAAPSAVRQKLLDFAVVCENNDVNCLWQWETRRVLEESIVSRVANVAQVMSGLGLASVEG